VVSETRETAQYYQAADIFLCTSRLESYPRVVLEAMAYRLPLITTPVFGIREQVREGYNAVLYEPGDVTELVRHIETIVADDERRHRMAFASESVLALGTDFDAMATAYGEILVEAWLTGGQGYEQPVQS